MQNKRVENPFQDAKNPVKIIAILYFKKKTITKTKNKKKRRLQKKIKKEKFN